MIIKIGQNTDKIPEEWDIQVSLGFCDKNRSTTLSQTTRPSDIQQQQQQQQQQQKNLLSIGLCRIRISQNESKRKWK